MERFWKYRIDHVLFWTTAVAFHVYTRVDLIAEAGIWVFLSEIVLRNVLLAVIIYIHLEFLIPAYLRKNRFLTYAGGVVACFGFYILVKNTHDVFLRASIGQPAVAFHTFTFYNFSIALFYMVFSTALYLSKAWYFQLERVRQLEVEKLNTELEYLKSQINPHFLFNSLNTIFFQIDRTNSEARDTLTKFADLLRFQLYECNVSDMPIEKEITYIRNYVDLQRLRKEGRYHIDLQVDHRDSDFRIAPLLVIPLVENAFKHVSHRAGDENRITIHLEATHEVFRAQVWNTTDKHLSPQEVGGIGLKNLRRRLELQYAGRHELKVRDTGTEFDVQLEIRRS